MVNSKECEISRNDNFINIINIINCINYISIINTIAIINKNLYKSGNALIIMGKKGVGVTLDNDVIEAIKEIQSNSRGAKFSPLVNDFLREHPDIKKILKKNGKNKV